MDGGFVILQYVSNGKLGNEKKYGWQVIDYGNKWFAQIPVTNTTSPAPVSYLLPEFGNGDPNSILNVAAKK